MATEHCSYNDRVLQFPGKHDGQILGEFRNASLWSSQYLECNCGYWEPVYAGFDMDLVAEHLKTFSGVKRRFTEKNLSSGTIDTMSMASHHPTEIIATLDAVRKRYPSKRDCCYFSNHIPSHVPVLFLMEFAGSYERGRCCLFGANLWFSAMKLNMAD